jgi:predicted nucleotide-binding protein
MSGDRHGNIVNYGSGNIGHNNNSFTSPSGASHAVGGGSQVSGQDEANPLPQDRSRNVFVVSGRDEQVRRAMFLFLRQLDLRPLEWEDAVRASGQSAPYIGSVVAQMPSLAQAALILLTPDDVVTLHPALHSDNEGEYETRPASQPRPDVLIELGMMLMAYPERALIVEFGSMRPIEELSGRNVIRFDGSQPALSKIVERLKAAGCYVNDTGTDWRQTWAFRDLSAFRRRP